LQRRDITLLRVPHRYTHVCIFIHRFILTWFLFVHLLGAMSFCLYAALEWVADHDARSCTWAVSSLQHCSALYSHTLKNTPFSVQSKQN
jgi:hypothetical protein